MTKSYLKTGLVERSTIIDNTSGEILSDDVKVHSYLANSKEEFFLCYSAIIGALLTLEQSEIRVFAYMLNYADGTKIDVSKKMRLEISRLTRLNERTVYNTLPRLLEKGLLCKHDTGLYQVNPRYAFKGSSSERNSALKAVIELGCETC